MARHCQAIQGYQAIHGWPGSLVGPEQMGAKSKDHRETGINRYL